MFSQKRKKIFIFGAVSSYGTNVVSIVVGLISVPIGLHYFGPVRYGIWAVISSLIAYLGISNLGISTGATVLTAKAREPFEQWAVLRRSLFLLLISSVAVLSVVLGIDRFYPGWVVALGKIPLAFHKEASNAVIAITILFLLNLPLTVFFAGFTGLQKVYWERFYISLRSIAGLVALIFTVSVKGNLVSLALSRGLIILLVSIVCALHFLLSHTELLEKVNKPVRDEFSVSSIFSSSLRFFSIGIAAMVVWNTDNLVISHFLGAEAVTPYAITFKFLVITFSAFTAINSAIFPMYGKAAAFNQWEWVQQTYNRTTCLFPIIGGLIWIGVVAFAKDIIIFWTGSEGYGGRLVIFALGGYGYLLSMVSAHSNLITGINAIKNTVFIGWLEAAANFIISIILVRVLGIGGVALGTFLGSLLTVSWMIPLAIYIKTKKRIKFNFCPVLFHTFAIVFPFLISVILVDFFWKEEISKIFINIIIISIYLILSWQVISHDLRNLFKSTIAEIYTRIKNLRVLNI